MSTHPAVVSRAVLDTARSRPNVQSHATRASRFAGIDAAAASSPKGELVRSVPLAIIGRGFRGRRLASCQLYSGAGKRPHDPISVVAPLYLYRLGNIDPRLAFLTKLRSSHDVPNNISDIAMRHTPNSPLYIPYTEHLRSVRFRYRITASSSSDRLIPLVSACAAWKPFPGPRADSAPHATPRDCRSHNMRWEFVSLARTALAIFRRRHCGRSMPLE